MNQQYPPEHGAGLSAQDIETGRQVYLGKLKAALSAYQPEMAISLQQVRELAAILEALDPAAVHEAYVNAQRAVAAVQWRTELNTFDYSQGLAAMQDDAVRAIRTAAEEAGK